MEKRKKKADGEGEEKGNVRHAFIPRKDRRKAEEKKKNTKKEAEDKEKKRKEADKKDDENDERQDNKNGGKIYRKDDKSNEIQFTWRMDRDDDKGSYFG
jgi:hypothetical protein